MNSFVHQFVILFIRSMLILMSAFDKTNHVWVTILFNLVLCLYHRSNRILIMILINNRSSHVTFVLSNALFCIFSWFRGEYILILSCFRVSILCWFHGEYILILSCFRVSIFSWFKSEYIQLVSGWVYAAGFMVSIYWYSAVSGWVYSAGFRMNWVDTDT